MLKRMLALGLAAGLIAGIIIGCGSGSNKAPAIPTGSTFLFVKDTPICDVLTFRTLVTGLTLHRADDNSNRALLGFNSAFKVNFASLRDNPSILALASLPEGTYDQATVTFTSPTIVLFNNTRNPPVETVTGTIAGGGTLQFPIEPNLVVSTTQVSALMWDFDLLHTIQVDASGNVTGALTPTMTFSTLTAGANQGFGEMDDLIGFVNRVNANPIAGTPFVGTFNMQFFSNSVSTAGGPSVAVDLLGSASSAFPTPLCIGPPPLGSGEYCTTEPLDQLLPDTLTEVDGYVSSSGDLIANTVEAEDLENPDNNQLALIGIVTAATTDPSGDVTSFEFYLREQEPDDSATLALDGIATVNVSSVGPPCTPTRLPGTTCSTVYDTSARSANFADLSFGPNTIWPGQELMVSGVFTKTPGSSSSASTVAADKIVLKLQTHQGSFVSLLHAASDDETGAFRFNCCNDAFNGAPLLVFTNGPGGQTMFAQTQFVNVRGLSELIPTSNLLIKGLLFYENQATAVNGVAVPAGTFVLLAKEVHQL
jgi:hypothetical protein